MNGGGEVQNQISKQCPEKKLKTEKSVGGNGCVCGFVVKVIFWRSRVQTKTILIFYTMNMDLKRSIIWTLDLWSTQQDGNGR